MIIKDRIYGEVEITEPVLLELIKSKPVQRLKGINQSGASQYVIKGKDVTRYEHSLGVMILLMKLNTSVEEQIAGLLHDVPHTAFSHVIDFVFKSMDHEFHEKFHEKIIMESEIPKILEKYGFETKRLLDEHNFPLLEKSIPDLCGDRLDYTLRDMTAAEGFSEKMNEYISSFIVKNNEIIINNEKTALKFAKDYLRMDKNWWAHPTEVALFQILADAIKIALDENIITENDLFHDDLFVYTKLKESNNKEILEKLNLLTPGIKILEDPEEYLFHSGTKPRFINPKFLNPDNTISRVTDKHPEFQNEIDTHVEKVKKGHYIKFVR